MFKRKCVSFCLASSLLLTGLTPALAQDVTVDVNGKNIPSTPQAYVANGRTLMPAQELADAIQAKLAMNGKQAIFTKDMTALEFLLGETGYRKNGVPQAFDATPVMKSNTYMVPVRPVGESYRYDVNWLAQQQHVNIADKRPVNAYIDETACGNTCVGYVINGRTVLPLRAIIEALGGKVIWDDKAKCATITIADQDGKETVLVFTLGKTVYTKDGKEVSIDQALLLINDHLYIPVRHLSDAIGKAIGWDEEAYAVYLGKGADEATARTKAYQERLAKEKTEAEKAAREKAEAERLAKEQAAREKAEAERLAKENAAKEQARIEAGKKEALKEADYVEEHITQGPDRIIGNWKGYWKHRKSSTAKARYQYHVKKAADGDYYVVACNYNSIDSANNREGNDTGTLLFYATYDADKDAYFFQLIKDSNDKDWTDKPCGIWYQIEDNVLVQIGEPVKPRPNQPWGLTISELYRF